MSNAHEFISHLTPLYVYAKEVLTRCLANGRRVGACARHDMNNHISRVREEKEKDLCKKSTNLFFFLTASDPLPDFAKGRLGRCGGNRNPPRFLVLFRNRKRTFTNLPALLFLCRHKNLYTFQQNLGFLQKSPIFP